MRSAIKTKELECAEFLAGSVSDQDLERRTGQLAVHHMNRLGYATALAALMSRRVNTVFMRLAEETGNTNDYETAMFDAIALQLVANNLRLEENFRVGQHGSNPGAKTVWLSESAADLLYLLGIGAFSDSCNVIPGYYHIDMFGLRRLPFDHPLAPHDPIWMDAAWTIAYANGWMSRNGQGDELCLKRIETLAKAAQLPGLTCQYRMQYHDFDLMRLTGILHDLIEVSEVEQ